MPTKIQPADFPRRSLLKLVPVAGAAAIFPTSAHARAAAERAFYADARQPRLADSEHVRTYYKLARR